MIFPLLLAVFAAQEVAPPAFFASNDELRGYLMEAGENSPELRARYAEWQAAMARIPQATSLDDPMLSYGQFLQSEVNRFRLAVNQKFPWFGTLRTRGEKAAADADAALERLYAERNRVFADVKEAYFNYALLAQEIHVTDSQAAVLAYMEDVVRSKLSLGLVNQDDLLRVSIEQAKVKDRYDGFVQMRPAFQARLNAALGRSAATEIPWPGDMVFPPSVPAQEDVFAQVRATNPDLKAFDSMIEGREKQVELAKLKGYPDLTLGLEFVSVSKPRQIRPDRPFPASLNAGNRLSTALANRIQNGTPIDPVMSSIDVYSLATAKDPFTYSNGGEDNLSVSLTMNVPIWRKKIRAGVSEAELMKEAAEHQKAAKTFSLESATQMALFNVQDAQRRYRLYSDTLVPEADQAYNSLLSEYSSEYGMSSFLDVLGGVQTLLDFQLEQLRAARDWQVAAAELEYLMGGPWKGEPIPYTPIRELEPSTEEAE